MGPIVVMDGHYVIYHCYSYQPEPLPKRVGVSISLSKILLGAAKGLAIGGMLLILSSFLPSFWYTLTKGGAGAISKILVKDITEPGKAFKIVDKTYQPRFEARLSKESRLIIPSIGVDTFVQEATSDNFETALKKGTWRVSDFGTPADRSFPTILTAHRYGYLAWSNIFRRKNSFYNLSKLKVGDTVEIVWKQRRYLYEIYAEGKGDKISDYTGDLILYTCETLSSPVRIYKYARLLEV